MNNKNQIITRHGNFLSSLNITILTLSILYAYTQYRESCTQNAENATDTCSILI